MMEMVFIFLTFYLCGEGHQNERMIEETVSNERRFYSTI